MTYMSKSVGMMVMAGASLALPVDAAPILFADAASFEAHLVEMHTETFEDAGRRVSTLDFGGGASATVSGVGSFLSSISVDTDGSGGVALGGSGRFWRVMGGPVSLAFADEWDAFGFWYSDLENATLVVTTGDSARTSYALDDDNPNVNHFFGMMVGGPFTEITIEWAGTSRDAVGFDDMMVGRVPAPGAGALAGLACLCAMGRGRRRRRAV